MNKSDLVLFVAQELRTSRLQAARVVDSVLGGITRGLQTEQSVTLAGFGTFEVKPRKARSVRNPQTGQPMDVEAGRRVGFRVGKGLKQSV